MDEVLKCPRGHELEDGAVLCTVCWVRVVPEDPEIAAARARRRRRRIWLPFVAASAIGVGALVGATLASSDSAPPAVVAEAPAPVVPAASSSAEAVVAVAQPEAATVADPVTPADDACTVSVLSQEMPCAIDGDALTFAVCVADDTASVELRTRADETAEWQDLSSTVRLDVADACASSELLADVEVSAAAVSAVANYRLVGTDQTGAKLWKSKMVVDAG